MSGSPPVEGFFHININVTDLERSVDFYSQFGFRARVYLAEPIEDPAFTSLVGLEAPSLRVAALACGDDPSAPLLDLVEWVTPPPEGLPYDSIRHVGIARIALRTSDLDAAVAALRAAGQRFWAEPGRLAIAGGLRFAGVFDPDGVMVELLER